MNVLTVKQLHKDFQRAGSDVLQLFTFYATDSKLHSSHTAKQYTVSITVSKVFIAKWPSLNKWKIYKIQIVSINLSLLIYCFSASVDDSHIHLFHVIT